MGTGLVIGYKTEFFISNTIPKIYISLILKTDPDLWDWLGRVKLVLFCYVIGLILVISCHSRGGEMMSYSQINMVLSSRRETGITFMVWSFWP